jgi:nucleoside-diphosphate-sugar epimerase
MFSYTYVSDIISGLLFLLAHGQTGQAYNIASDEQKSLKEIAMLIGEISGSEVKIDLASDVNVSYSKAEHALLDTKKIKALGWKSLVSLQSGLTRTFSVLS